MKAIGPTFGNPPVTLRLTPLLLLLSAALTATGAASGSHLARPRAPNVVLFLADDLGWEDCSINRPDAGLQTPQMERVARDGMRFSHAFVASPSCAPSRGALLTGLLPPRNGALFNHTVPNPRHRRWPAYFREAGYETVAIGKVAHYATVRQYGFDQVSHFTYHDDACTKAAVDFIRSRAQRDAGKPLCLLVGTNWPHVPWPEKAEPGTERPVLPSRLLDTPETRTARARYLTAVAAADRDLGMVYAAARETLGDNTLFLFTSDHGSQFPFGKWNCYDTGIRTPLLAVWPGKIRPGSRSDALVSWVDLLPTCLEAAGVAPPKEGEREGELSGRSFLAVLLRKRSSHRERIFTTHSGDGKMNEYPIRALRTRDWKYIRNLRPETEHHTHVDRAAGGDGRSYWVSWEARAVRDATAAAVVRRYHHRPPEELYDLRKDPDEQHNLAADPAHERDLIRMRRALDEELRRNGDSGLALEETVRPKG